MSRQTRKYYRLDELIPGDEFEYRSDGESIFGSVAGEGDLQGIDVFIGDGRRHSRRQNWPSETLVRKVEDNE